MKKAKIAVLSFCLGLLSVAFVPKIKADEWDKKTTMTFNQPVRSEARFFGWGLCLQAGGFQF